MSSSSVAREICFVRRRLTCILADQLHVAKITRVQGEEQYAIIEEDERMADVLEQLVAERARSRAVCLKWRRESARV